MMKHLRSHDGFDPGEIVRLGAVDDLEGLARDMRKSSDFYGYWEFAKKHPTLAVSDRDDNAYSMVFVKLSNHGVVTRRIPYAWRLRMFIEMWRDIFNETRLEDLRAGMPKSFMRWLDSNVNLYKGVAKDGPVPSGDFVSMSLSMEMAIRFTQPGWVQRAWGNESARNGKMYKMTVRVADAWIYNQAGGEYEVVVRTPKKFDAVKTVVAGKIETTI